jgi:methyl-accepting chemotaxis protein
MGINEEVARAFGSHTLWKTRIERAAEAGKSEFKPDDVCKDALCTFGKWLHDPKLPADIRASRHYAEVNRLHAEFHQAAGGAIKKAISGDTAGARRDVEHGTYAQASKRFFDAMFVWQRAAAVSWSGLSSPLLKSVLIGLNGKLSIRLWAGIALPGAAALASLFFIHAHADALRAAGTDIGWFEGLLTAALVGGALLAMLLTRGVARPLRDLTEATRDLAKGNLDAMLPAMERADELGELARAVLVFQEQARAVERIAGIRETERSKSEAERRDSLVRMAENIESQTATTVGRIAEESERVHQTAKSMARGATMVEENAQLVAAAAEQSLINAQTVASATDKLSESIRGIAGRMEKSREVVGEAVRAADNASATVDDLAQAMAAIDQVVQLIADIAGQTNLLALNATIEAARAGEAGKGFAVVANEVKNLANQTARQTTEISDRIGHLGEMAKKVGEAIQGTVGCVQDVEAIATEVAHSVQEQQSATDQISRNVAQSAIAAREVSDRIVEVADEAVNTGRQAGQVEKMLHDMAEQVGELGRTLTRMVRTSTPEVNRREAPRYPLDATVRLDGHAGRIEDISATGARVTGVPRLSAGAQVRLQLDALDIPAVVVEGTDGLCRVKFAETQRDLVDQWLRRKAAA